MITKDKYTNFDFTNSRCGSKETSRAYRTPLFQKSQAWLKQALVEAHRSHQIKETAVKLLQRDLFCRNLAVYNVDDPSKPKTYNVDNPPKPKTLYEDLKVLEIILYIYLL